MIMPLTALAMIYMTEHIENLKQAALALVRTVKLCFKDDTGNKESVPEIRQFIRCCTPVVTEPVGCYFNIKTTRGRGCS